MAVELVTIDEAIHGCPIDSVDLAVSRNRLTIDDDAFPRTTLCLRLFEPRSVDGQEVRDWGFNQLAEALHVSTGDEYEFYRYVTLMVAAYTHLRDAFSGHNGCDERNIRKFCIETLGYIPSLRDVRDLSLGKTRDSTRGSAQDFDSEAILADHIPNSEVLRRIAGTTSDSTTRLLAKAIFTKPVIFLTNISEDAYQDCRDEFLSRILRRIMNGEPIKASKEKVSNLPPDVSETLRAIFREAEYVCHAILNSTMTQIYRKIRHRLTVPERRAFALLYLRQPAFGNRAAFLEPLICSFFDGMDDTTRSWIFMTLPFKRACPGDISIIERELHATWRAYLRFYPSWLHLVRSDERTKKEKERKREAKIVELPLDAIFEHADGTQILYRDTLEDPAKRNRNLDWEYLVARIGNPQNLIDRYCDDREAEVVAHCFDEKTEKEIAALMGITQQAVNKQKKKAFQRTKVGLERDGIAEDLRLGL